MWQCGRHSRQARYSRGIGIGELLTTLFCAFLLMIGGSLARAADPPLDKLNVVVILIDDMGWTDLGCYGSSFYRTPHIDALAASGMRFTNGYSACTVCSPTRAALLTGKYPARLHITDWIAGHVQPKAKLRVPDWTKLLPHEETTFAELFHAAGYATAHVGKWHLGPDSHSPTTQGFDLNIGGNPRGQPPSYFFPYERENVKLPGLEKGTTGEYLTDRLTDEALAFIDAHRAKPFLLYWPHYTVHTPLQAKKDLTTAYQGRVRDDTAQRNATYAAMIHSLDESVGRLRQKLDELKLTQNTVIIFTSDNGGLTLGNVTSNVPLRAGKGSAYEGGVRVPFIVSSPKIVPAETTCDVPVSSIDLFPTLLALAGISSAATTSDGESLEPLLRRSGTLKRDTLYWHYPHYHPGGATPYGALRERNYRLVEFYEDSRTELYDLANDVGEKHDLSSTKPDVVQRLREKLHTWRTAVGAQMPTPNPDYAPQPETESKKNKRK